MLVLLAIAGFLIVMFLLVAFDVRIDPEGDNWDGWD
jgi:hypothetical protein